MVTEFKIEFESGPLHGDTMVLEAEETLDMRYLRIPVMIGTTTFDENMPAMPMVTEQAEYQFSHIAEFGIRVFKPVKSSSGQT